MAKENVMENKVAKVLKKDLIIEKKVFVNAYGESVEYLSYSFELDGQKFNLSPKTDDKKLLNFLLRDKI